MGVELDISGVVLVVPALAPRPPLVVRTLAPRAPSTANRLHPAATYSKVIFVSSVPYPKLTVWTLDWSST